MRSVLEQTFDDFRPEYNMRSSWSDGSVVETAAKFFASCKHVLDIGSGIGKFVIMSAQLQPDTIFTGVEINPKWYDVSVEAKEHFGVKNVNLIKDDFCNIDLSLYDGFYIFNPFFMSANLHNEDKSILHYERMLYDLKIGTKLVMHNQCYTVPRSWERVKQCDNFAKYYIKRI